MSSLLFGKSSLYCTQLFLNLAMKTSLQPAKSFDSAAAVQRMASKGLKTIVDNRPTAVAQRKLQGVVQGKNLTKSYSPIRLQGVIQCVFPAEEIAAIRSKLDRDGHLKTETCSTAATRLFNAARPEKSCTDWAEGIESLGKQMRKVEKDNGVFVYHVDTEVIGHQFVVLQKASQAIILQGYVDRISIQDNFDEIARNNAKLKSLDTLLSELSFLMTERNDILESGDSNDEARFNNRTNYFNVHNSLFDTSNANDMSAQKLERMNMIGNRPGDLRWRAGYVRRGRYDLKVQAQKSEEIEDNSHSNLLGGYKPAVKKKSKCIIS